MKRQSKFILILFLATIFCAAKVVEKQFNEYKGGRLGYSRATLKLYADSTYYYSEWVHTGRSIKDNGKWGRSKNRYYLTSKSKTKWTGKSGTSNKIFRFEMQEFIILNDTLKMIPKNVTDCDYFESYYKFYKVTN